MVESAFVGGAQDHAGSLAGLKRFLPTRGTEAPTVAGFQAAKSELRHRGRKIVAAGFGKREKRGGHDGADRVATDVLSPGVAAAVSKEAGHGVYRAEFKPVTEHVTGRVPPTGAITAVVPQHCCLRVGVADRLLAVMQRLCVPVKNVSAIDIGVALGVHFQWFDRKFASARGTSRCELRNPRTTRKSIILVSLLKPDVRD